MTPQQQWAVQTVQAGARVLRILDRPDKNAFFYTSLAYLVQCRVMTMTLAEPC